MAPFRRRGYRFAICKPSVIVALIQKSFVSFVKGIQYLVLDNFSIIQHLVFKLLTNAIGIVII